MIFWKYSVSKICLKIFYSKQTDCSNWLYYTFFVPLKLKSSDTKVLMMLCIVSASAFSVLWKYSRTSFFSDWYPIIVSIFCQNDLVLNSLTASFDTVSDRHDGQNMSRPQWSVRLLRGIPDYNSVLAYLWIWNFQKQIVRLFQRWYFHKSFG